MSMSAAVRVPKAGALGAANLRHRLAYARVTRGFATKRKLSLAAGLSETLVAQIERGQIANPRIDTIETLAKVLGVSVAWLTTGEGPGPSPK